MNQKTKIFVIFRSQGRGHEVDWDAEDMQHILTNQQVISELTKRCKDVEFAGKTEPINEEAAVELFHKEKDVSGILAFGPVPYALLATGLPIITVFRMWQTWMFNFSAYKHEKVLFDCLPMVRDRQNSVFSERMNNLVNKIRLIQAISKMNYKILSITDASNFLGGFEKASDEEAEVFRNNTAEVFGTKFKTVQLEALFNKIRQIDQQSAEQIADRWIKNAYCIKNTNRAQVIESAKVYLSMKELRDEYECDAVTTEGYGIFGNYKKGVIPSQCLAATQLSLEGMITPGECLMNSMLIQQVGYYLTGKGSFNGDYIIEPFLDLAIIGHCECPLNIFGDDHPNCSYALRNMPYHKKNEGGACVQVNLPADEPVTVVQLNMYGKQISVFNGITVPGEKFFAEWDSPGISCRTKLAIKTNTGALLKNFGKTRFSNHRAVFFGDYRKDIENLAKFIGFELIEEDK
jgi:hypothetical protein